MATNSKIIKQKYAEGFNSQMINLFKELTLMYPDNKDFKYILTQVRLISNTTYELPIQTYEMNFKPYRDHLNQRNEQFFLEFNLQNTPLKDLDYLKEIWKTTTDKTKDAMWRYFVILDKLSMKYHGL